MEGSGIIGARIVNVLAENAEVGSGPGGDISSFEGAGYTVGRRATDVAALALVIAKSEELVLPNGSANSTSKLVPVSAGNTTLCGRLSEWIAGEIRIGPLKIECRSVDLVGA